MLLAKEIKYKEFGNIIRESKVRRSGVGISLTFGKKSSMLTQLGTWECENEIKKGLAAE